MNTCDIASTSSRSSLRSAKSTRSRISLDPEADFIDYSKRKLALIQDLSSFTRLQVIDLSNNNLESVDGIDSCRELWYINLSNNKLKCLNGFSDFVAIGTLALANNQLSWRTLTAIQHLHVVHLVLQGNPGICRDKYYREHAVDSFPNVWILDGRYVSAYERIQNEQFFQTSALGQNPVRRKFKKDSFLPTSRKNTRVNGVFGRKATDLMINFPVNGKHNIDIDRRRMRYLSRVFEDDIIRFAEHKNIDLKIIHDSSSFLLDIVELQENRNDQKDVCNMLVLLLLCSLEFTIPTHLLTDTLEALKIIRYGPVNTLNLFLLPKELRCIAAQALFGCTTLSFHTKASSLQEHLFYAMQSSITQLTKISLTSKADSHYLAICRLDRIGLSSYRSLLASELIYQMCLVPTFYEVLSESNVMYLVSLASGDISLSQKLVEIMQQEQERGETLPVIYDILSALICRSVNKHVVFLIKKINKEAQKMVRDQLAMSRRTPQPLFSSDYLTSGRTPPSQRPASVTVAQEMRLTPDLGDEVLIGPQNIGRIIAVPSSDLVQIQMRQIPVPNGGMTFVTANQSEHYAYVNMDGMEWDKQRRQWHPKGSVGDKVTFQMDNTTEIGMSFYNESVTSEPPSGRNPSPRPLSAVMQEHHPAEMVRLFEKAEDEEFLQEISRSIQELRVPAGRNTPSDAVEEQAETGIEGFTDGEIAVTSENSDLKDSREVNEQSASNEEHVRSTKTKVLIFPESDPRESLKGSGMSENVIEKNRNDNPQTFGEIMNRKSSSQTARRKDPPPSVRLSSTNSRRHQSAGATETSPLTFNASVTELKVPNLTVTRLANDAVLSPRLNLESYQPIGRNGFFDDNVSMYQRQRAEAWRAKTSLGVEPPQNEDLFRPKRGFRLARKEAGQWLGNGRDLFAEEQMKRPSPVHSPGWKQNNSTVCARRTLRRGETPSIQTPSSMLYDCYCRHPPTQFVFGDEHLTQDLHLQYPHPLTPQSTSDYRTTRRSSANTGYMCLTCLMKRNASEI